MNDLLTLATNILKEYEFEEHYDGTKMLLKILIKYNYFDKFSMVGLYREFGGHYKAERSLRYAIEHSKLKGNINSRVIYLLLMEKLKRN